MINVIFLSIAMVVCCDHNYLISERIETQKNHQNYELYIQLAIDILKIQDLNLLGSFKNFLYSLPSATHIERVLMAAIYQLAEVDPEACRWILRNHQFLMPELDLIEIAKKWVQFRLQNRRFIVGRDFTFAENGRLDASEQIKILLKNYSNVCLSGGANFIALLREEILQI